ATVRSLVTVAGVIVAQEDQRPVDERPGDGDTLLLAAGELVGHPVFLALEPDELEHGRDVATDLPPRLADDLQRERDVLEDRLVRQQPEVLEHRADASPQVRDLPVGEPVEVLAGDPDPPGGGALLLERQPQERRLAGAGRAHEEHELTLLDLHGEVVESGMSLCGVLLADVVESDHVASPPVWMSVAPAVPADRTEHDCE